LSFILNHLVVCNRETPQEYNRQELLSKSSPFEKNERNERKGNTFL